MVCTASRREEKMARDVYNIPHNFAEEGTILNGKVRLRNAVEAVMIGGAMLIPLWQLPLGIKPKIYIGIIVILPVLILAVVGVMGESLFSFILSFMTFLIHRRVLQEPVPGKESFNSRRNHRTSGKTEAGKRAGEAEKEKRTGRRVPKTEGKAPAGKETSQRRSENAEASEAGEKKKRYQGVE